MSEDNEYLEDEREEIENAIELTDEFKNQQPCSIIELVSLFKNDEKNGVKPLDDNPIVKETKEYLNIFNKYGVPENVTNKAYNIRRIFSTPDEKFTPVEQTLLVDLVPSKADEAFKLIPTLKAKSNLTSEELEKYLEPLNREVLNN